MLAVVGEDQRSELHPFAHKIKITSYPVHESGGIVWTYMGPPETMTPFRDFGTDTLPASMVAANKELVRCNWVQSMDGDLDTAHISNLHQFDAIDDVPDDGTDKPGYPSGFMSMKFWRYGGAPFFTYEKYPFEMLPPNGVIPRPYNRENDYNIDRFAQKGLSYSGIADFRSQDAMVAYLFAQVSLPFLFGILALADTHVLRLMPLPPQLGH